MMMQDPQDNSHNFGGDSQPEMSTDNLNNVDSLSDNTNEVRPPARKNNKPGPIRPNVKPPRPPTEIVPNKPIRPPLDDPASDPSY